MCWASRITAPPNPRRHLPSPTQRNPRSIHTAPGPETNPEAKIHLTQPRTLLDQSGPQPQSPLRPETTEASPSPNGGGGQIAEKSATRKAQYTYNVAEKN